MLSIDQNSHSLWDALPKLQALAAAGRKATHLVEDIDVAFTDLGATVADAHLRIVQEQFHASGGAAWGAALFYSDFLGRLPSDLREWEPMLGMKIPALAKKLGVSQEDLYGRYSVSDNWMLVGPSYIGDRHHHRVIGDLTVGETIEFVRRILRLAEQDCLRSFPEPQARQRTRGWFSTEHQRIGRLEADLGPDADLASFYQQWLELYLAGTAKLGLTSDLFALGADAERTGLMELFTRDYDQAAGLYNQAVDEANVGVHKLHTAEGELPFFAVLEHKDHLVRTGAHLDGSTLRLDGREFRVGPDGQLPLDDLRAAGVRCLSGKAVLLVLQARVGADGEALALPHNGSLYMPAARRFEALLGQAGLLPDHVRPVVRVRLRLLDRLADLDTRVALPGHLIGAFGAHELPARELAARWSEVAATATQRLERLTDADDRAAWQVESFPELVHAIGQLDTKKRDLAGNDPKSPAVRKIWQQIRDLQNDLWDKTLQQVFVDTQASQLGYYDSRGAILPWCIALGGEGFYNDVLARAEITEEPPA